MRRTQYASLGVGIAFITVLQAACGVVATAPASLSEDVHRAGAIFTALAATPTSAGSDSFLLAVSAVDAASVSLCVASQADCRSGQATRLNTQLLEANGRRIHVTAEPVTLKADLVLTAVARDASGAESFQSYRITSAAAADERSCYKAPDDFSCEVEGHIARLTSEFRTRSGRSTLTHDRKSSYVSRLWSAEQARQGSISHQWFQNGRWRQEYVKEFQEQPRMGGENVAMSGGGTTDAEAVARTFVNMWINSSGHRANMLGSYSTIGVGVARRGSSWYATQNFGN